MAKQELQASLGDGLLPWQQEGHLDQAVFQLWFSCLYYVQELADHHKVKLAANQGLSLKAYLGESLDQFQQQDAASGELQELKGLVEDTSSWLSGLDKAFSNFAEPKLDSPASQPQASSSNNLGIPVVDLSTDTGLSPRTLDSWIKSFQQLAERHRNGMQEY